MAKNPGGLFNPDYRDKLRYEIDRYCRGTRTSQTALAENAGVGRASMQKVLAHKSNMSITVLEQLLTSMGLCLEFVPLHLRKNIEQL